MSDDHVYLSLAEGHDDDARWAYGTGFEDPLHGVDTTVPEGVDAGELAAVCVALGDDALVSAQRLAEWTTRAPELEEEVALANIGLDLLGQARLLYSRAGQADGTGRGEDAYAYFRDADDFRNVRLAELPGGDFAFSIVRLLVLSSWRLAHFERLVDAPRPGPRGDRGQGRQGADVPPAVRRRMGRAARRRHGGVAPADPHGHGASRPRTSVSCSPPTTCGTRSPPCSGRSPRRPGCRCRCTGRCPGAGRDRRPHRASGAAARRVAERGPRPPGGDMVTTLPLDARRARHIAEQVPDPELPMLTLADLGVLRDVELTEDGTVVASLTPTYSGCPAMAEMRADVAARLRAAGYTRVEIRTVLDPPWTTDWITDTGRRKLDRTRHRPTRRGTPAARSPLLLSPTRRSVRLPPLRLGGHRGDLPLRRHVLQGPVALPRLPRAVRARQGDLMEGLKEEPTGGPRVEPGPGGCRARPRLLPARLPRPVPSPRRYARVPAAVRSSTPCGSPPCEPLCEDAAAVGFEIPAELAEEFAFAPGQSLTLRREIDGRDERRSYSICSPAGSAPRIGVRVVPGGLFSSWLVNGVRPGDTVEVMGPDRLLHPRPRRPRPPRADRGGLRHHAHGVHRRVRPGRRPPLDASPSSTATGAPAP